MTTTLAPFDRVPPMRPAHLIGVSLLMDDVDNLLQRALHSRGRDVSLLEDTALALRNAMLCRRTDAQLADEARYEREVDEYNAAVRAYNAAVEAAKQARVNARGVAKVRASACPRCFATHAGEC